MARRLLNHEGSDCLFEEYDDLAIYEFDVDDVTGVRLFEERFKDEERERTVHRTLANKKLVSKMVTEQLIATDVIHSCINCGHWDQPKQLCTKYNMLPPAEVIVYSCGDDWFPDIPF